jgi:hypothetical protein
VLVFEKEIVTNNFYKTSDLYFNCPVFGLRDLGKPQKPQPALLETHLAPPELDIETLTI